MKTTAREGQCLVDIALAATGSVEGVWALALRNGMSVTGELGHGTEIAWEAGGVTDARVAEKYAAEGICPATAVSEKTLAGLLDRPVIIQVPDYMTIKADPVKKQQTRAAVFTGAFTAAFS